MHYFFASHINDGNRMYYLTLTALLKRIIARGNSKSILEQMQKGQLVLHNNRYSNFKSCKVARISHLNVLSKEWLGYT